MWLEARAIFADTGSAGLATALANAATTQADDVIRLAAGSYAGPFSYTLSGNAGTLQMVGAGAGQTILSAVLGQPQRAVREPCIRPTFYSPVEATVG
jgi:hypothetical protein